MFYTNRNEDFTQKKHGSYRTKRWVQRRNGCLTNKHVDFMKTYGRLGGLTKAHGYLVAVTEMRVSHRNMEDLRNDQSECDSGLTTIIER